MTPQRTRRRAAALALAALAVLIFGLATAQRGDGALYPGRGAAAVAVYLSYNGFHSDLEIPTAALSQGEGPTSQAMRSLRPEPWTAIGWGDANFYQGRGISVRRVLDLLHSVLWPVNASVVHLESVRDPRAGDWRLLALRLSPGGLQRLRARLDRSFTLSDGQVTALGPRAAHGSRELFFKSQETASVFHLCNHWTGELLHAAGAPVTPILDLSSAGLAWDLQWRAGARAVRRGAAGNDPPPH